MFMGTSVVEATAVLVEPVTSGVVAVVVVAAEDVSSWVVVEPARVVVSAVVEPVSGGADVGAAVVSLPEPTSWPTNCWRASLKGVVVVEPVAGGASVVVVVVVVVVEPVVSVGVGVGLAVVDPLCVGVGVGVEGEGVVEFLSFVPLIGHPLCQPLHLKVCWKSHKSFRC